jgi:hypothetical protein
MFLWVWWCMVGFSHVLWVWWFMVVLLMYCEFDDLWWFCSYSLVMCN